MGDIKKSDLFLPMNIQSPNPFYYNAVKKGRNFDHMVADAIFIF